MGEGKVLREGEKGRREGKKEGEKRGGREGRGEGGRGEGEKAREARGGQGMRAFCATLGSLPLRDESFT